MAGLHELRPARGSRQPGKRVGRGNAARRGNFSGRGIKGQRARESIPPLFEGGQLPLVKRLPAMRGFKNRSRVAYQPVNIGALNQFRKGAEINPQALLDARIIRNFKLPIKILGNGTLEKDYKVSAHAFSAAARKAIEDSGGTCTELPHKRKTQQEQEDAPEKKAAKKAPEPEAKAQPAADAEPAKEADQSTAEKGPEPEAKAQPAADAKPAKEADPSTAEKGPEPEAKAQPAAEAPAAEPEQEAPPPEEDAAEKSPEPEEKAPKAKKEPKPKKDKDA